LRAIFRILIGPWTTYPDWYTLEGKLAKETFYFGELFKNMALSNVFYFEHDFI